MHDVVIIGGGHNGLVCSAYLAMAGLKVLVFDQRPVAGGAAVTEEFSPGFRNSVASYAVSLLNPQIIRDLDLAVHQIAQRVGSADLPLHGGQVPRWLADRMTRPRRSDERSDCPSSNTIRQALL